MTYEEQLAHTIPYSVAKKFGNNSMNLEIAKDLVSFAYFVAMRGDKTKNLKTYVYVSVFREFVEVLKRNKKYDCLPLTFVDNTMYYEYNSY